MRYEEPTPGEWKLLHVPACTNEDGSQTIEHWIVEADGWEIYNTAFMPVSRGEREANAFIIASSKNMLLELERKEAWMLDHVSTDTEGYDEQMQTIREAIRKARTLKK